MASKKSRATLQYTVAAILAVLIILMVGWIVSDFIHCTQSGGVFVKGIPWYACVGSPNG